MEGNYSRIATDDAAVQHRGLTSDSQEPLISPEQIENENRSSSSISSASDLGQLYKTKKMSCCGLRCCVISSLILAVVSAILAFTFPLVYHSLLNYELSLQSGTVMWTAWKEAPVPMHIKFYFFNVTNSEDIVRHQAKPVVQQIGPYTFTEKHERVNIETYDNFTLKFQQKRTWHFVPELSNGTMSDDVTTLNVPAVGASYTLRHAPLWFKIGFNRLIARFKSTLYLTKNVQELLFDGYEDPLLDLASHLPPGTVPPYDKFGWFYQFRNLRRDI